MSKNARAILIIIVLVIVVGIAIALARQSNAPTAENGVATGTSNSLPPAPDVNPPAAPAATTHVVVMNNDTYTPASLTVKVGDTVTWRNDGTQPQWPASAVHPTHLVYPEFDPKTAIAPGASWSFTFTKAGAWRWHDHIHANVNGTVTVTQ